MIVKGKSRSGAAQLSEYLLRDEPGQSVRIVETAFGHEGDERTQRRSVFDSLMHFEEMAAFTKGEKGLYHAKLNPDALASQRMEHRHWSEAADITAVNLGKAHQPRVIVLHEKEDGRVHGHVVFMRTEQSGHSFRLISDSHNYAKHEQAAREIEAVQRVIGHQQVRGQFTGRERDAETGHFTEPRPGYDPVAETYKPKSYDQAAARQSEKTNVSSSMRKAEITALWRQSDSGQAFVSAAQMSGYDLARGDRKPIHMLVSRDAQIYDLRRNLDGVKKQDIVARLEDYPAEHLPTVAEACKRQREALEERQHDQAYEATGDRQRGGQAEGLKKDFDTATVHAKDDDAGMQHEDTPEPFDSNAYQAQRQEKVDQAGIDHARAEEQARKRQALKEWADSLRVSAQNRQHDEIITLGLTHDRQTVLKDEGLRRQYGDPRQNLEQQIAAIKGRQEHGGFWYWLSFQQRREDRESRAALQQSIEDSRSREEKDRATYKNEQAIAREALQQRHAQERQHDEQAIAQAFETGRVPEVEVGNVIHLPQGITHAQEHGRDEAAAREAALRQAAQEMSARQHSRQQAQVERARDGPSP